jgi:hypothetical protein
MATYLRISVLLLAATACGFPKPADVPDNTGDAGAPGDAALGAGDGQGQLPTDAQADDAQPSVPVDAPADAAIDAPASPGSVIRVSTTGDDANDGMSLPVKTLKHAIGIAAANSQITSIVLASGRYSSANGETYPYTVPTGVRIAGPAGGGAILVGTKTEPGINVGTGTLQDLELEDFTAAITATGMTRAANIRIRSSTVALRAETTAKLTIDNLDISGIVGACATGIILNGSADLAATMLTTRSLGTTLDAKDQSAMTILKASITGSSGCSQVVMSVKTNKTFLLQDSVIDGGRDAILLGSGVSPILATIVNTILRNAENNALNGGVNTTLNMTGGEIQNNGHGGAELAQGDYNFTNVLIKQNRVFGIYMQDGILAMRNCSVVQNGVGVNVLTPVSVDLGTVASAGNNILQNNSDVNLYYDSSRIQVEAVGNIWNPGIQGSDGSSGRYANPEILQGPIPFASGNNYYMSCDRGQCTLHR